jgi:hypothetical protein
VSEEHGVKLWLPEAHGPVDPTEPSHQALLILLGAQSKREVLRAGRGRWRPCGRRPATRVGFSAADRCMGIGWWMLVHIRIRCTRSGPPATAVRSGSGDRADGEMDFRGAVGGAQCVGHRGDVERGQGAKPVAVILAVTVIGRAAGGA